MGENSFSGSRELLNAMGLIKQPSNAGGAASTLENEEVHSAQAVAPSAKNFLRETNMAGLSKPLLKECNQSSFGRKEYMGN
jgi:hypothetical protein